MTIEHKKISHKLEPRFDRVNQEKKTKYTQLYNTFKKSLGISACDVTSKREFDSAFDQLVTQLKKPSGKALAVDSR